MVPVWKLIGFVIYVILYFSVLNVYTIWPAASVKSVFFRVMPVLHLIFVVVSTSMDEDVKVKSSRYRWHIALGLIAACIGDGCTVFLNMPGMIISIVGHLFFIRAFGIRPLGSGPMVASFAIALVAVYFFLVDIIPMLVFKVAVVAYMLIEFIMSWRSMVVLCKERSFDSFLACLGSTLLVVADVLLIIDKYHEPFNLAPFWIMLTHYVAQLGIALSACDTHSIYEKRE